MALARTCELYFITYTHRHTTRVEEIFICGELIRRGGGHERCTVYSYWHAE